MHGRPPPNRIRTVLLLSVPIRFPGFSSNPINSIQIDQGLKFLSRREDPAHHRAQLDLLNRRDLFIAQAALGEQDKGGPHGGAQAVAVLRRGCGGGPRDKGRGPGRPRERARSPDGSLSFRDRVDLRPRRRPASRAALFTITTSQVRNALRPSKSSRCVTALRNPSCTASRASCSCPRRRYATR